MDRATWWALGGSVLLALLYCHLTLPHLTDGIVGGKYNGYENLWNDYWLRTALRLHRNPFFTTYLEYPTGVSLRYHTLDPLGGVLALPLWPLVGPIAAMNIKFILSIVGSAFFAYLLMRDLTGSPLAAFGGAVVYTYANALTVQYYTTAEENYLMGAALLPLYIFFLLRAADRPRWWRDGVAATLLLFALCLTDWQYTMFAVLFTLLYFCYTAAVGRSVRAALRLLIRLALIGGVWAAIIFLPLLLPMIREAQSSPWLTVGDEATGYARSLQMFLAPGGIESPGYLVLGVTLVGLFLLLRRQPAARHRQATLFWLCIAVFAVVMSLGPRLELKSFTPTRIPLPYALLTRLPVLNVGRKPHEFYASLAMLAFGALFAFALGACLPLVRGFLHRCVASRPRFGWVERIGAPSLVAILLSVTVAPFFVAATAPAVFPFNVPSFYRDVVAKDPDQYAILEVPIFASKRGQYGGTYQAFQIVHGKPRFGASISRDHNNVSPFLFARHATLFRDFFWLPEPAMIEQFRPAKRPDFLATPAYSAIGLPLLNYYHVRYLALYRDALLDTGQGDGSTSPQTLDAAERLVHQALDADARPVFQDSVTEIYRVPDAPPLAQPVFLDTGNTGWYAPEMTPEKIPYRFADMRSGEPADLLVFNLSPERQRVRIQFTAFNYKAARTIHIAINGSAADQFALAPDGMRDETLDLDIPPGMSTLTLTSPEPPVPVQADPKFGRDDRLLGFGVRQVRVERLTG